MRWCAGEWLLGDSGFVGISTALTPIKKRPHQLALEPHQEQFNDMISHVRSLVEHQFSRFKRYACLSTPWRHDVHQHHRAFNAVARLVQLDLILEAKHTTHPALLQ